jgi:hypothetical protein
VRGRLGARLLAGLAASLVACALTRRPPLADPERVAPLEGDRAATWRIGVREPTPRVGPDQPGVTVDEIGESAKLIEILRASGLFYEIDFTRQLHCPVDLEVVAVAGGPPGYEPAPIWFELLTLSVRGELHEGVSFHAAAAPEPRIDLRYETGVWAGIAPAVLWPFALFGWAGDWSVVGDGRDEVLTYRSQLLARGGSLAAHVGEGSDRCAETDME